MHVFYQKEIREIDQQAEQQGFSLFSLMENAGRGLAEKIEPLLKADDRIIILCGRGNNGGDGIVIARYLLQAGFSVSICFPLGDPTAEAAKQICIISKNKSIEQTIGIEIEIPMSSLMRSSESESPCLCEKTQGM